MTPRLRSGRVVRLRSAVGRTRAWPRNRSYGRLHDRGCARAAWRGCARHQAKLVLGLGPETTVGSKQAKLRSALLGPSLCSVLPWTEPVLGSSLESTWSARAGEHVVGLHSVPFHFHFA